MAGEVLSETHRSRLYRGLQIRVRALGCGPTANSRVVPVVCSGHAAGFVKGCCRTRVSAWDCIHSDESWKGRSFASHWVGYNSSAASGSKAPALFWGGQRVKSSSRTLWTECCFIWELELTTIG